MRESKTVAEIMEGLEYQIISGDDSDLCLLDITADSRAINSSSLFIARKGAVQDGHAYLAEACSTAAVIVVEAGAYNVTDCIDYGGVLLEVTDTNEAYAVICANFFGKPGQKLFLTGITGTNGKTTISYLLEELYLKLGYQVGVIGTVNNRYTRADGEVVVAATSLTTPDAKVVQQLLRRMVDDGVSHVIMEVSSHALAQSRVGGLLFDAAIFTNISRDHLDYHHDMDSYFSSKQQLFSCHLKGSGIAILPAEHRHLPPQYSKKLQEALPTSTAALFWGDSSEADLQLLGCENSLDGLRLRISYQGYEAFFESPLLGRFNVDNLLALLALAYAQGVSTPTLQQLLPTLTGAPGRVERVQGGDTDVPVVLVDYAHTPDALEKLLSTLGDLPHDDLYAVFGCGGDRDKGKRPLMGAVGAREADVVLIADDNPRSEESVPILQEIAVGVSDAGMKIYDPSWLYRRKKGERGAVIVGDRRRALTLAISVAGASDIVAIAGKGHEPYQLGASGKIFFDDRIEAAVALDMWSPQLLAKACGGVWRQLEQAPFRFCGIATDSRALRGGELFVALRGERFDGHLFAEQAVASGAAALVVDRYLQDIDVPQLLVVDTLQALGDFAHAKRLQLRDHLNPAVVAITGSSGKTTIKEMVASIFAQRWPEGENYPLGVVGKTLGNFNNLIGLPLSLLPATRQSRALILEMGMNSPGEIARLADIAEPDICVVANVHGAHLQGLGSIEGVASAKEELFYHAPAGASLMINCDDPRVLAMASRHMGPKIFYSCDKKQHPEATIWASSISFDDAGYPCFVLHVDGKSAEICLAVHGEHNIANALAAVAVAQAAGICLGHSVKALQAFRSPAKRFERIECPGNWTIISDCYNANPESMKAGIHTFSQLPANYKVALLADMLELGDASLAAHRMVGAQVAEAEIDLLLCLGEFAHEIAAGAEAAGMGRDSIICFGSSKEAYAWLAARSGAVGEDDSFLYLKGSRGMSLETLIPALMAEQSI